MIKIGIAGADTPVAGELLRLCMHHPDVDVVTVHAPGKAGLPVSSHHHGFIGEERILFTSNFDATGLDIAFLLRPIYSDTDWVKLMADRPQLRLVLFDEAMTEAMKSALTPVYGLSEINRKQLVRGARVASVPAVIASPLLVGLYPLARHLMLSGQLQVEITAPADVISPEKVKKAEQEIGFILPQIQTSFTQGVTFSCHPGDSERGMRLKLAIPTTVSLDEIFRIYESVYDDHNFTFTVSHPVSTAEVEGTEKVLIYLAKPDSSTLDIEIVADPRMRGGAGEALHLLNLLSNLHERTGLDLKTSAWLKN